jgi:hypothetical protein
MSGSAWITQGVWNLRQQQGAESRGAVGRICGKGLREIAGAVEPGLYTDVAMAAGRDRAYNPARRADMSTAQDPSRGEVISTIGKRRLPTWVKAAIGLFVVLVAVWLISVLSLPGLRTAAIQGNEASAIGYVHEVANAQRMAAQFNKGYFLPLSCLSDPAQCPPAVSPTPLLAATLTDSYSTYFSVDESPTAEEIAEKGAAARSVKTWSLTVLPREPGKTGQRVFCTDTTGGIFFTPDSNTLPNTAGGRCGGTQPLQ